MTTITRNRWRDRFNEITDRGAPFQANLCFDLLRSILNATRERFSTDDEYPILPLNPVTRTYKIWRRNKETPRRTRIPRNADWYGVEHAARAVHRQFCKLTKTKGGFPNDDSLLKLLYMGIINASKKWTMPIQLKYTNTNF